MDERFEEVADNYGIEEAMTCCFNLIMRHGSQELKDKVLNVYFQTLLAKLRGEDEMEAA